jgi:selenocysteine lyase/cysteine desulfurase
MAALSSIAHKDILAQFTPDGVYLNTATYGLPPKASLDALDVAIDEWRHGRTGFDGWDRFTGRARASFARMHGVPEERVAIGPQVSVLVADVAATLPRGARVLVPEGEFTSAFFPLLVAGHGVRYAPLERIAEAVEPGDDLVALSAVQSSDGRVADLGAVAAAAAQHGVRTLVDATQASGWLPLRADDYDVLIAGGYKWLLNPRGTAFMTMREALVEEIVPLAAGWYAGEVPMETLYGGPLRLARSARRLDVSPAWLSWIGAAPALELIEDVGVEAIHAHDLRLANAFREGLGMPPGDSAIVSLDLDPQAEQRLRAAGIMCAGRGGRLRFSFHLYSTERDVELALAAVAS